MPPPEICNDCRVSDVLTTPSQEPKDESVASALATRTAVDVVAFALLVATVASYFWFVDAYGVNTFWLDQWSDLNLIQQAYSGHLTLALLWSQHTDNRILFPNLVVLLLARTTQFNVIDEEFLSSLTLVLAAGLLIIGHRRRSPSTPLIFYVPVAFIMLSFVQYGNTLWGFQFAWYLVVLAASVALVLCDDPRWNWFVAAGSIVAATVGSYSSLQGLLIWPAGFVVLILRRRTPPFLFVWVAAGALTTAIYFVNYDPQQGQSNNYVLHHPAQAVRFFFLSFGDLVGTAGGTLAFVLGIVLFLTALSLVLFVVFRDRGNDAAPLGIGLICFGLLFAVTLTIGRAVAGYPGSRYMTFALLTLVGCYLVILGGRSAAVRNRRGATVLWYLSLCTVGVTVCLTLILGTINGLDGASTWRTEQIRASRVIANIEKAPASMVQRDLRVSPFFGPGLRSLVAFARQNDLSLFASRSTLEGYVRAGLPYQSNSLMTVVLAPPSGATVRGNIVLLALAQSDFGIKKVDFEITAHSGESPIDVSAVSTPYGWWAQWDTARLPSGQYEIRSVAYDRRSHQAESSNTVVYVKEPPVAVG